MNDPVQVPSQAEAMLRRVSPEGRAKALAEQRRKQKAMMRLVGRCLLAGLAILLALAAVNAFLSPLAPAAMIGGLVLFLLACFGIAFASRERAVTRETIAAAPLAALPEQIAAWLEAQRSQLPPAAADLVDTIAASLGAMAPQLAPLDPGGPAAESVRRLVGRELPALLEHYQTIPVTLRAAPRDGGASADAQLVNGLGIAEAEIGRMTEQLARGAFDELATQNRFLELKYEGEGGLGSGGG
jgi:hypothetical protein